MAGKMAQVLLAGAMPPPVTSLREMVVTLALPARRGNPVTARWRSRVRIVPTDYRLSSMQQLEFLQSHTIGAAGRILLEVRV